MKNLLILLMLVAAILSSAARAITIEDISPHLSTNAQITWAVGTNSYPEKLWTYKILPNTFTRQLISNAVVLASFERFGFPKPSTNEVVFWDHTREGDDPLAGCFAVLPKFSEISFRVRNWQMGSSNDIPNPQMIAKKAWECAAKLGLDISLLSQGVIEDNGCEYDDKGHLTPHGYIGGRSINLVRKLDAVDFQEDSEGFSIEFGSHGIIRSFALNWPNLQRDREFHTVSPGQIIGFIRAHKSPVFPNKNETTFFERIKSLSQTKTLIITKISPRYGEGIFGEVPNEGEQPKSVTPYAEIQAVADFGNSNMVVRMAVPIIILPEKHAEH